MLRLLAEPEILPPKLLEELSDRSTPVFISAISLWEIVIKSAQGRPDFQVDAAAVRSNFVKEGVTELAFTPDNAIEVSTLPRIHDDPFDRALIAQAREHGLILLTTDSHLCDYPAAVRRVNFRKLSAKR